MGKYISDAKPTGGLKMKFTCHDFVSFKGDRYEVFRKGIVQCSLNRFGFPK